MTHTLKSYPQYFLPTILGQKVHEIRSNSDTGPFGVGDMIVLNEYDPGTGKFTGRTATEVVTYISPMPQIWMVDGFTTMSTKLVSAGVKGS